MARHGAYQGMAVSRIEHKAGHGPGNRKGQKARKCMEQGRATVNQVFHVK
jgi:hypothetical protein